MTLLTISSEEEQRRVLEWLIPTAENSSVNDELIWTGGYLRGQSWIWEKTQKEILYTNWFNAYIGTVVQNRISLIVGRTHEGSQTGEWAQSDEHDASSYICEKIVQTNTRHINNTKSANTVSCSSNPWIISVTLLILCIVVLVILLFKAWRRLKKSKLKPESQKVPNFDISTNTTLIKDNNIVKKSKRTSQYPDSQPLSKDVQSTTGDTKIYCPENLKYPGIVTSPNETTNRNIEPQRQKKRDEVGRLNNIKGGNKGVNQVSDKNFIYSQPQNYKYKSVSKV